MEIFITMHINACLLMASMHRCPTILHPIGLDARANTCEFFCAAETITCAAFQVMPDTTPNSTYLLCISEAVIVVLVGVVVHCGRARLQERKAGMQKRSEAEKNEHGLMV